MPPHARNKREAITYILVLRIANCIKNVKIKHKYCGIIFRHNNVNRKIGESLGAGCCNSALEKSFTPDKSLEIPNLSEEDALEILANLLPSEEVFDA